uniref:Endonuclease/exonuclease/phosphatase domain-containing protein n=1 Tax=Equus caballus TaxID=9796 RepID=A0A9L0R1E0_HORSE
MLRDINNNTIIVGDLNIPLTPMDRTSRQKINKEIIELNEKLDQMDLIDIYRTLHPKTAEYTFFSSEDGTFFKLDILVHKQVSMSLKRLNHIKYLLRTQWNGARNQ